MKQHLKGFTLIELIVVIGIIAILAGIVIVAVNPARQFAQARNTQRTNDGLAILNGVHQYAADNSGNLPSGIPQYSTCSSTTVPSAPESPALDVGSSSFRAVGSTATPGPLSNLLVPTYLSAMPVDPSDGTATATDYLICKDGNGRVTVWANGTETSASQNNAVIKATR